MRTQDKGRGGTLGVDIVSQGTVRGFNCRFVGVLYVNICISYFE